MNAPVKFDVITPASKLRDFVMQPPKSLDRITFNTPDDGVLAGYVSVIRQHLGNGQKFAWVELDNELAGQFRGVPLIDIISCDNCGDTRRRASHKRSGHCLYLADYSQHIIHKNSEGTQHREVISKS